MGLFRRGRAAVDEPSTVDDAPVEEAGTDAADEVGATPVTPTAGPWDAVTAPVGERVDLGALRVPAVPGMELRMEIDQKTQAVQGVQVVLDGSSLQMQAFAAPRTEGIWDEVRAEIVAQVTQQGGSADDLAGPFGREVLARLPVRTPEGRTAHRPFRFLGTDGPRWFVRGLLAGRAAVDPEAARRLEEVYAGVVVVRGGDARPPRELLPLHLPGKRPVPVPGAQPTGVAPVVPPGPDRPTFDPLTRGPEMTETR